jgi:predicted DNA-binding transcriptional regulator YafY
VVDVIQGDSTKLGVDVQSSSLIYSIHFVALLNPHCPPMVPIGPSVSLMSFETTGRKQVIRWVLSWMPDVKVLFPKSLRDRVCEKLEAGLRLQ